MFQCDVCPAKPFRLDSAANFCKCGAEYDGQGRPANPTVFKKAIIEALGYNRLLSYSERGDTIRVGYDSDTVTFEVLQKISKITGSTNINFSGEKGVDRISEVTADSWAVGTLVIDNVKYPPKPGAV